MKKGSKALRRDVGTSSETPKSSSVSLGPLGTYLGFRMRRVHDIQARHFRQLTRGYDLSQGMFTALVLISSNSGISQASLAHEMGLDKSAVVALIDRIEQRGWVERHRSKDDRRRYKLVVTAIGEKTLSQLLQSLDRAEAGGLETLSKTEFSVVSAVLDKLYSVYRDQPWAEDSETEDTADDAPRRSGTSGRSKGRRQRRSA